MAIPNRAGAIADPMIPRPVRVINRHRETADTWTLELDLGGERRFRPGQFHMLYVFGVGEIPISISGDATRGVAHTVRAAGAVSKALAALRPGDSLGLRGPFGEGWPLTAAEGRDVVLVAGGLGLAPLRSALHYLIQQRERYGEVVLLYGTRSPGDILFQRELQGWLRQPALRTRVTVDHADTEWTGHIGVVTTLINAGDFDPDNCLALVCGPELMMRFTAAALSATGVPESAIYLSMERNMKCAVGHCGHCQFGPAFVCRDGPVLALDRLDDLLNRREI